MQIRREQEHPSSPQQGVKVCCSGQESPVTRRRAREQSSRLWNVHCPKRELERRGSMCSGQQENQSSKMRDTTVESTSDHLEYFEAQDVKFKYL